ncbi:uncharacterized protein LOC135378269 [Ornithodoros turicata]|uniref:uncharacterized protein LOC135378269 n=1 Tax=Ornithodoros turicata TaxID=34597 RepID=UPI003139C07D
MRVCGVRGCVNTKESRSGGRKGPGIRYHKVPKNEPARTTWLRLIGRDAVPQNFEISVCYLHFRSDDYVLNMALADASGVGRFRGRLTPGATPSLNLPTGDQHAVQQKNKASLCIPEGCDSQASDGNTAWTGSMVLASQHGNEESSHASETVRASPGFLSPDLDTTPPNTLECMNCGCKQLKSTCSTEEKSTQYSPPKESRWTQTVLTKTRTTGTQANRNVAALQTSCTQTSEELCQTQLQDSGLPWQSMQTSCNRTSEEPHQANQQDTAVQWEPKRCSTPVMDVTESSTGDTENPADTTYVPSNDSVLSCVGSLLRVKCYCPDGHIFCWESQPYIANKPAGNVLLSAAILFSGASPIPTLRMLQLINVKICPYSAPRN